MKGREWEREVEKENKSSCPACRPTKCQMTLGKLQNQVSSIRTNIGIKPALNFLCLESERIIIRILGAIIVRGRDGRSLQTRFCNLQMSHLVTPRYPPSHGFCIAVLFCFVFRGRKKELSAHDLDGAEKKSLVRNLIQKQTHCFPSKLGCKSLA